MEPALVRPARTPFPKGSEELVDVRQREGFDLEKHGGVTNGLLVLWSGRLPGQILPTCDCSRTAGSG